MSSAHDDAPVSSTEILSLEGQLKSLTVQEKGHRTSKSHRKGRGRTKGRPTTSVPFSSFKHSDFHHFPDDTKQFFKSCEEVATYQGGRLFSKEDPEKPVYPCLQIFAALIAENRNAENKLPYLGCDLYEGHERYKPLSSSELDSSIACFEFLQRREREIGDFDPGKITIISPRHHVVNLVMALYHNDEVSIICTNLGNGKLLFSEDKSNSVPSGLRSKNPMTRKICYSGFAFEEKLTTSHDERVGPFYSIVEGRISDRITMLLRCEMDAYNPIFERYTELKCFAKLNVQEKAHRRKLLKTWVQIGLIPNSDLIIGTRDTQVGQLEDLTWYSKKGLYKKFNNPSIARSESYFNFNANIAVEWCYHCIESICDLVTKNSSALPEESKLGYESFKVVIDKSHNIVIRKLTRVPRHVQIKKKSK